MNKEKKLNIENLDMYLKDIDDKVNEVLKAQARDNELRAIHNKKRKKVMWYGIGVMFSGVCITLYSFVKLWGWAYGFALLVFWVAYLMVLNLKISDENENWTEYYNKWYYKDGERGHISIIDTYDNIKDKAEKYDSDYEKKFN